MKITKRQLRKIIREQAARVRRPTPGQVVYSYEMDHKSVSWREIRDAREKIYRRYSKRYPGFTSTSLVIGAIARYLDNNGLQNEDTSAIAEEIVFQFENQ